MKTGTLFRQYTLHNGENNMITLGGEGNKRFMSFEECSLPKGEETETQKLLAKVLKHKEVVHFGLMREIQESFDQAISEGYSPHDSLIHAIYAWDLDPYIILNYIRDEEA